MKFNRKHIINTLSKAVMQGTAPRKLAITCALGVIIGLFPLLGTTTMLCFVVAIIFRLNIPVIQLVNYLIFPLQIILLIPFIKAGAFLFGLEPLAYNSDQLIWMFRNNFWKLLQEIGWVLIAGVSVWLVVAIPLFFIVFYSCLALLKRWRPAQDQRELKSQ